MQQIFDADLFRHSMDVQVRFNDIDALGHVNNNVYLQFFDLGKYDYFRQTVGVDLGDNRPAAVVVNINCDFMAPTFIEEPLAVRTAIAAIGEKSLTMVQQVYNRATGQIKCQGTTVMASFDFATGRSTPVPAETREAFSQFEGREF